MTAFPQDHNLDVKATQKGAHEHAMHRHGAHFGPWRYDRHEERLLHVSARREYPVRLERLSTAKEFVDLLADLSDMAKEGDMALGDFMQALSGLVDLRDVAVATFAKPFDVKAHLQRCARAIDQVDARTG